MKPCVDFQSYSTAKIIRGDLITSTLLLCALDKQLFLRHGLIQYMPLNMRTIVLCLFCCGHGPLARYVKLRVAHAPGMPGTFSLPQWVGNSDMHHGTCVTHVPWCMSGSLTNGFRWSRWREKHFRYSRCMRNPRFYVSGKRLVSSILVN